MGTGEGGVTGIQPDNLGNKTGGFAWGGGPITEAGSQGLRASFSITKFSRNEPLEEAITVSVTAKPTYSDNPPEWMTVSA